MILDLLLVFWVFVGALVSSYVLGRILCFMTLAIVDRYNRWRFPPLLSSSFPPRQFADHYEWGLADYYEWELDCDYTNNPQGFRLIEKK